MAYMDEKVTELKQQVDTAIAELDHAIAFHEMWKPTVHDESLLQRMGTSFATNAFLVIRTALRREMLLALLRLWDRPKEKRGVRMTAIAEQLRHSEMINALVVGRVSNQNLSAMAISSIEDHVRSDIADKAARLRSLVHKWTEGGSHAHILKQLRTLRDEVLAHRSIKPTGPGAVTSDENDIEDFFQDNLEMVRLLSTVVNGIAYNPNDTAGVYRRHAELFWSSARGERTEGHPSYRNSAE
jgi:hypothetical protein